MVERACAVRLERVRKLGEAPDAAHCFISLCSSKKSGSTHFFVESAACGLLEQM